MNLKPLIFICFLLYSFVSSASNDVITKKITDNVYSIFTDFHTSLVVIGDDQVLLTDPANAYRALTLKSAIASLTHLPVTHIVLTQERYEYIGGTEIFEKAQIITQQKALPVLALDVSGQAPSKVSATFDREFSIQVGTTTVKLIHFGYPSVGIANSIVYLPEEKLLYCNDFYDDESLLHKDFIQTANLLGLRATLNQLSRLQPQIAIAGNSSTANINDLNTATQFYNALFDATITELNIAQTQGARAVDAFVRDFPNRLQLSNFKYLGHYDQLSFHAQRMLDAIINGG